VQFSSTSWGQHEIMQIDINSPKSAFLNEKISEESWIFTLLQLSQIVQIKNLMTEGSL